MAAAAAAAAAAGRGRERGRSRSTDRSAGAAASAAAAAGVGGVPGARPEETAADGERTYPGDRPGIRRTFWAGRPGQRTESLGAAPEKERLYKRPLKARPLVSYDKIVEEAALNSTGWNWRTTADDRDRQLVENPSLSTWSRPE